MILENDVCAGSGTVAKVCQDLGRRFISFEISAKYCEIAKRRLAKNKGLF